MRLLTNDEQIKNYAKYYSLNLFPPAFGLKKEITTHPLAPEHIISLDNRTELLHFNIDPKRIGYCCLPDGTAYVSTYTYMPRVTPEMIDWWFAWHGLEDLRYVIWDKEDHYSIESDQHQRLTDDSIPMRERIWGVTHKVLEDTGCGPEEITIHFKSPYELFDRVSYDVSDVRTTIWANGSSAVMCHTIFDSPGDHGIVLCSHFWLGWNMDGEKPVKIIPDNIKIPEQAPKGLALHSIKEYANLGNILPYLYAEYVENKKVILQPVIV